jgi:hypothetical protein
MSHISYETKLLWNSVYWSTVVSCFKIDFYKNLLTPLMMLTSQFNNGLVVTYRERFI